MSALLFLTAKSYGIKGFKHQTENNIFVKKVLKKLVYSAFVFNVTQSELPIKILSSSVFISM